MSYLRRIIHPDAYSGIGARNRSFEGWYYKLISPDRSCVLAVIAGVARGGGNDKHSFVQLINSVTGKSHYIRYAFDEFSASGRTLDVRIGKNRFTTRSISLDICTDELSLRGSLSFTDVVPFPRTPLRRSIMGPFLFVPCMECYHGVVNIAHRLNGTLTLGSAPIVFDGGSGYVEKDGGVSFPSAWVWMQANEFEDKSASFMLSVADIPFLSRSFVGLLAFVYVGGRYCSISTYNGGKVAKYALDDGVLLVLQNNRYKLSVLASQKEGNQLVAPCKGLMNRPIAESVSSTVAVTMLDKKTGWEYADKSGSASLELAGDVKALLHRIQQQ